MGKSNTFYDRHIEIGDGTIRWENYTCFISAVTQFWLGRPGGKKWGMAAEGEEEGLNIELKSGSSHCFISDNPDFLKQAYELLYSIAAGGHLAKHYTLDFENNVIDPAEDESAAGDAGVAADAEPDAEAENPSPLPEPLTPGGHSLKQEILMLTEYNKNKKKSEPVILNLLKEIASRHDSGNSADLPELYKSFIQLSLINDCNELGLDLLIAEVKAHLYG